MTVKEMFLKWRQEIIYNADKDKNDIEELKKIERDLEVLEIIKKHNPFFYWVNRTSNVDDYNDIYTDKNRLLNEEEYKKLKEWLKNE